MTTKTQNPHWQRLSAVIERTQMSANSFALHIGLQRPETLYRVKHGQNGISAKLADRITAHFPEISKSWLLCGEGTMLKTDTRDPSLRQRLERCLALSEQCNAEIRECLQQLRRDNNEQ